MSSVYFISSAGDSDLAVATIDRILENNQAKPVFVVPLTWTAVDRVKSLQGREKVSIVTLGEMTGDSDNMLRDSISDESIERVRSFVDKNNIHHAYAGVPSNNNETPFQIAYALDIPTVIAYEYMFRPKNHCFWRYLGKLGQKSNIEYAVPLEPAAEDIRTIHPEAVTHIIGHLSLDRDQVPAGDTVAVKNRLKINPDDELVFISGTSIPDSAVDNEFVDALLSEIATGNYPHLQLRMGLHPGVKNPDHYLQTLLTTCAKYPSIENQFRIILNDQMLGKLHQAVPESPFLLHANVSGPDAAAAADRLGQAVPGALLNEGAKAGKPVYFHEDTVSYLPKKWFASNIGTLFEMKPEQPHSKDELGLTDSVSEELARTMIRCGA